MKFFSTIALLAAPLLVLAQSGTDTASASASTSTSTGGAEQNPPNIPANGYSGVAGSTLTITWKPTTSGTVSLQLREGPANNLNQGTTIASNIANSGSYTWSIPSDTPEASDYAIEIVSPEGNNYTPRFKISSSFTGSASSGSASSTTASGSTAASSDTHTHTHTKTDSSSASAASSTSGMSTTTSSSTTSQTSSASSAGFQSSASHTGAAPRATAAAGMMGLVALGALAL